MNTNQCMAAAVSKQRSKFTEGGINTASIKPVLENWTAHYVGYLGNTYLVVKDFGDSVKFINSTISNRQLKVQKRKLVLRDYTPAIIVKHKLYNYAVCNNGKIFSLQTGKLMEWSSDHGNRTNILALSEYPQKQDVPANCTHCVDGYIAAFHHVSGGICFTCHGKG